MPAIHLSVMKHAQGDCGDFASSKIAILTLRCAADESTIKSKRPLTEFDQRHFPVRMELRGSIYSSNGFSGTHTMPL